MLLVLLKMQFAWFLPVTFCIVDRYSQRTGLVFLVLVIPQQIYINISSVLMTRLSLSDHISLGVMIEPSCLYGAVKESLPDWIRQRPRCTGMCFAHIDLSVTGCLLCSLSHWAKPRSIEARRIRSAGTQSRDRLTECENTGVNLRVRVALDCEECLWHVFSILMIVSWGQTGSAIDN